MGYTQFCQECGRKAVVLIDGHPLCKACAGF